MTDRPAPRPSAASLTGPRRSPWLGQRSEASSRPQEFRRVPVAVTPVAGQGLRGCPLILLAGEAATFYLANFLPCPSCCT